MPLAEGQVIAGYKILRSLGAGGMGEVYLAQHPRLPRRDALKVLSAAVCAESEYRQRFNREADIAATLWHPHIVEVHDRGDVDGQLWISMDYVEGTDAARLLIERYPKGMPPDLVLRIVTAVGDALDYAHQRGLTHRDVKPANILLSNPGTDSERIMLADFGIARRSDDVSGLTGTNTTVGTVEYAAPEQLKGEDLDGRADQYALAATAFQLLTGTPPFHHSNPAVVISKHLTADPPKIGVPPSRIVRFRTGFRQSAGQITCRSLWPLYRLCARPRTPDGRGGSRFRCHGACAGRDRSATCATSVAAASTASPGGRVAGRRVRRDCGCRSRFRAVRPCA